MSKIEKVYSLQVIGFNERLHTNKEGYDAIKTAFGKDSFGKDKTAMTIVLYLHEMTGKVTLITDKIVMYW
jgi:hypothetical protein